MKICVWQWSFDLIGWSGGYCCPWRYLLKSIVVSWKQEALELGCIFVRFDSNGAEYKELSPLEGFSVSFRIPEWNSKKAWKPKRKEKRWEEFKSTQRSFYYIQNSIREKSWKRREKKERSRKKVGFYYINLYFRRIVFLRKQLQSTPTTTQVSDAITCSIERGSQLTKKKKKEHY